jgi:hypothetical protein
MEYIFIYKMRINMNKTVLFITLGLLTSSYNICFAENKNSQPSQLNERKIQIDLGNKKLDEKNILRPLKFLRTKHRKVIM